MKTLWFTNICIILAFCLALINSYVRSYYLYMPMVFMVTAFIPGLVEHAQRLLARGKDEEDNSPQYLGMTRKSWAEFGRDWLMVCGIVTIGSVALNLHLAPSWQCLITGLAGIGVGALEAARRKTA
jgi:hypothetical protein